MANREGGRRPQTKVITIRVLLIMEFHAKNRAQPWTQNDKTRCAGQLDASKNLGVDLKGFFAVLVVNPARAEVTCFWVRVLFFAAKIAKILQRPWLRVTCVIEPLRRVAFLQQ